MRRVQAAHGYGAMVAFVDRLVDGLDVDVGPAVKDATGERGVIAAVDDFYIAMTLDDARWLVALLHKLAAAPALCDDREFRGFATRLSVVADLVDRASKVLH